MKTVKLVIISFIALFISQLHAGELVVLGENIPTKLDLTPHLTLHHATTKNVLGITQRATDEWQPYRTSGVNKIGAPPFWIKINFYNDSYSTQHRIIKISNPLIDQIELYSVANNRVLDSITMGDRLNFSERPIEHNHFLYPVTLTSKQKQTLYLRIETQGSTSLPISLWTTEQLAVESETNSLIHGLQLGALLAIGLFSLFFALTSGSFSYSFYSGYVFSVSLLIISIRGHGFRYLWPDIPFLQLTMVPILLPLVSIFALLFTEKVLQLKKHSSIMVRSCRYLIAYTLGLVLITPFINYTTGLYINITTVMLTAAYLLTIGIVLSFRGHQLAKLYTLAWGGMFIGAFITGSLYLGLIELPILPMSPFILGLLFEIILMAAVLAIRFNNERREKSLLQHKALIQADKIRRAKDKALKQEEASNAKLEKMVQERTLELEFAFRELNDANQKLTEQASIDSLTGIKNRATFDKRLQAEGKLSRRQQMPLTLLMIDIDNFKRVNDNYSHLAGDLALKMIANILKHELKRPSDLVSRYGGEEFAIILPNTNNDGALVIAERIRKQVEVQSFKWKDKVIPLTVSIGISTAIIEESQQTMELLAQADKALYQAKNSGRNRIVSNSLPPQPNE